MAGIKEKMTFKRFDQEYRYMLPGIIFFMIILLIASSYYTYKGIINGNNILAIKEDPKYFLLWFFAILMVFIFWSFIKYDFQYKRIKKNGTKYEGRIILAEHSVRIYFIIEFMENGVLKKMYSHGYTSVPEEKLRSNKCSVYKYKNKYFEGDFDIRESDFDSRIKISHVRRKLIRKKTNEFVN